MVRQGQVVEVESLSELGIYGTFLRQGSQVVLNREAGHLVRTKAPPPPAPHRPDSYVTPSGSSNLLPAKNDD